MGANYWPHFGLVVETLGEASFDLADSRTSAEWVWIVIEKIAEISRNAKKLRENPFLYCAQCGNFRIFLSLRFYVKPIFEILEV